MAAGRAHRRLRQRVGSAAAAAWRVQKYHEDHHVLIGSGLHVRARSTPAHRDGHRVTTRPTSLHRVRSTRASTPAEAAARPPAAAAAMFSTVDHYLSLTATHAGDAAAAAVAAKSPAALRSAGAEPDAGAAPPVMPPEGYGFALRKPPPASAAAPPSSTRP